MNQVQHTARGMAADKLKREFGKDLVFGVGVENEILSYESVDDVRRKRQPRLRDPKKTVPIFPRNGGLSEKAGSGNGAGGFSGPGKRPLGAGGTVWENRLCSEGSIGGKTTVYLRPPEGQETSAIPT